VIWIIKESEANYEDGEIMLLMKYECTNENEFKILIRCIIIGLLIICDNSEIILGVN
jgi:hypothetical protein